LERETKKGNKARKEEKDAVPRCRLPPPTPFTGVKLALDKTEKKGEIVRSSVSCSFVS
jgi:hypothetical protein